MARAAGPLLLLAPAQRPRVDREHRRRRAAALALRVPQVARRGWTHDTLKVGDMVIVHGFTAKDGSHAADGREVTLPDGRKIGSDPTH